MFGQSGKSRRKKGKRRGQSFRWGFAQKEGDSHVFRGINGMRVPGGRHRKGTVTFSPFSLATYIFIERQVGYRMPKPIDP